MFHVEQFIGVENLRRLMCQVVVETFSFSEGKRSIIIYGSNDGKQNKGVRIYEGLRFP